MRIVFLKIICFIFVLFLLDYSFALAEDNDAVLLREKPPRYTFINNKKEFEIPSLSLPKVTETQKSKIEDERNKEVIDVHLQEAEEKVVIPEIKEISFPNKNIKNDDFDSVASKTDKVPPRIDFYVLSIDKTFDMSKNISIETEDIIKEDSDLKSIPRLYSRALPDVIDIEEEKKIEALVAKEQDVPDWKEFLLWLKGQPADDALNLGMFSLHTSATDFNAVNNMIALQYGGVSAGYFRNSWFDNTYFIAAARKVWEKKFTKDFSMNLQYKAGIMHGYGENAPVRIGPIEPVILPLVGFTFKGIGIDLWAVPSARPVFATNFRLDLPESMRFKTLQTKYRDKKLADKFGKSFTSRNNADIIDKSSIKDEKNFINYTPLVPVIMNNNL